MLLFLIKLQVRQPQWQHLMSAPFETSVSRWFISVLLTAAWDFDPDPAKMRLGCVHVRSRAVNEHVKGILAPSRWLACPGMLMPEDTGPFPTSECVSFLCVHSVPRVRSWPQLQEGPVPARESFGVRLLLQKCQRRWKWSRGKCVNGLVWELPLCQKQLVKMRSRESAD